MKKLLLALAACCVMFACDKKEKEPGPEPAETPELTLISESEVNVGADGDEVTITYTLANPAEGGEISASAAEGGDWCDGFNCNTDGQVTFTVAANEGDARETVVTVTYTYGEGEHKDITVTVKQVALGDPLFELTSESEVSVSKDGGDVTVTYSITDPREDGAVSVNVPEGVDWIINVNTDTYGQVTFTVAPNDGDAREAELTFVYTYGGNETQEFKVKVSQESAPAPVLKLVSEAEVEVSGDGGNFTINYEIENPREDGEISVSAGEATWFDFNDAVEGKIAVEVLANGESTERSAVVTVTYTYSEDKTVSCEVTVNQDRHYDYELNATIISGNYFGDDYSAVEGQMIYSMLLQDTSEYWVSGHNYYYIALKAGAPSDMNAIAPPVGTYTVTKEEGYDADGEFKIMKNGSGLYMTVGYVDGDVRKGMIAGELEVSYDGENYTIEGMLTDTYQGTHHISYTGPISLTDSRTPPVSLLTEDVTINWPSAVVDGQATYWEGRYYACIKEGYTAYYNYPVMRLQFYNYEADYTQGFPEGTYEIGATEGDLVLLAGSLNENALYASWYAFKENSSKQTSYQQFSAPLVEGTLIIERTSDTQNALGTYPVKFIIDAKDDAGNTIKGEFSLSSYGMMNYDSTW